MFQAQKPTPVEVIPDLEQEHLIGLAFAGNWQGDADVHLPAGRLMPEGESRCDRRGVCSAGGTSKSLLAHELDRRRDNSML